MQRVGERVKKRREERDITSGTLAKMCEISVSMLSQIEKGKTFPSVLTIKRIADALNTTVGDLIGENETLSLNPVVKFQDKKFSKKTQSGTYFYLLSHHDFHKEMETYLVSFTNDSDTGKIMKNHYGQEFCHVLKGEIEFVLQDKKYLLSQGDNLYFNSNVEHSAKNLSQSDSQMLWVMSPPNI